MFNRPAIAASLLLLVPIACAGPASDEPFMDAELGKLFEAIYALGLRENTWEGFGRGFADRPLIRKVPGGNVVALMREIGRAKQHFALPADAQVVSCYEAGRDGFWLHRSLQSKGVTNYIVDSASIEVNRRARHTKTDRLDTVKLLCQVKRNSRRST